MNQTFTFGYWVKRRRKALDLTQAALAHEVGCAIVSIRKIEHDERRPSRLMAERLADSLGIPEAEWDTFILSGLGEVSVHHLPAPSEPISKDPGAEDNLQSSGVLSILKSHSASRNNLPPQPTSFIGRESELVEIRTKLAEDDCRLLTLLGPGGSGKTRLAIEAAEGLLADYQHGVFFVNLTPVQSVEMIPSTIASALRYSFYEKGTPNQQLIDYLRKKQMLLILDNFEHLLEGACFLIDILTAALGVKILVTSRTRLMVTGEYIFDVWGMAYPQSPVTAEKASGQFSAVKLFEAQASRVRGDFHLSDDNLVDVIQICALLEGMPLGIVLAASWVAMLTPEEIAAEIGRGFDFLEKELRDLPQRQRGMRSVFNHSWRMLSNGQRRILEALSVFRGGFTREAAREVAGASLGDLMGLIDKSMLQRVANGRFQVHELMRQYAAEQLSSNPATEQDIRAKHSETFCQALAVWERDLQGSRQIEATQEMTEEIDNIRAAWDWAVRKLKIKSLTSAINGLGIYLYQNHQRIEGDETCQILVDRLNAVSDPDESRTNDIEAKSLPLKARALAWGGFFNWKLGNRDLSNELLQACLSTLKCEEMVEVDTRFEKALVYLTQSMITENAEHPEIKKTIEDTETLFTDIDEPWWSAWALLIMGEHAASTADGISIYEKSLKITRDLGDLRGIAVSLRELAVQYGLKWQLDKGITMAYEALEIYRALGDQHGMVLMYANIGGGMVWQGRFKEARSMECETLEMYADLGYQQSYFAWLYAGAAYPDLYLGEYQAAREQAWVAMRIYKDVKHNSVSHWIALAKDILGRAALAESAYSEAENWFQECAALSQRLHYLLDAADYCQTLACLGFAALGFGKTSQAQDSFYQALRVAIPVESYLALFHILPGIALLYADQGEVERAVELFALAATQGIVANSKWFADIAGDQIAEAAAGLPVEIIEAAKARGKKLDLWQTSKALVDEFEGMESTNQ